MNNGAGDINDALFALCVIMAVFYLAAVSGVFHP